MASVNISEKEFYAVASAASNALSRGDRATAYTLDDLAVKMNAALSKQTGRRAIGNWPMRNGKLPNFDIETPLQAQGLRPKK